MTIAACLKNQGYATGQFGENSCQQHELSAPDHALPGRRLRTDEAAFRRQGGLAAARRPVWHEARGAGFAARIALQPTPWGVLTALELGSRKILWQTPLGTTEELNPLGIARRLGTPTFGGPLATASGLIFIGATLDDYLRAFDAKTGAELWTGRLPSAGIATPTTYLWQGRQYVLIAAGGHGGAGSPAGDALVAFALPGPGEVRPLDLAGLARPAGRSFRAACRDGRNLGARCGGAVVVAAQQATSTAGLSSRAAAAQAAPPTEPVARGGARIPNPFAPPNRRR